MLSRHSKSVLNDEVSLGKALVDVALAPRIPSKGIGGLLQWPGEPEIAVDLGMQDGSSLPQSLERIEHGGQFLILYINQQFPLLVLSPQTSASRNEFWVVWPSISL